MTSRSPSMGMSKRNSRVRASIASSRSVSKSKRSVAKPASFSASATSRLRRLCRLLPLPWAKTTMPVASGGTARKPCSTPPRMGIVMSSSRVRAMPDIPSDLRRRSLRDVGPDATRRDIAGEHVHPPCHAGRVVVRHAGRLLDIVQRVDAAIDGDIEGRIGAAMLPDVFQHRPDVVRRHVLVFPDREDAVPPCRAAEGRLVRPETGDPDREARLLPWRGQEAGVVDGVVLAAVRERLAGPKTRHDIERLVEHRAMTFCVGIFAKRAVLAPAVATDAHP